MQKLIVILGPTAVGKTNLAVNLASKIRGEIMSADSRQVYKGMDIGTGKDLGEFQLEGKQIPHHLIDIREAGERYDLFQFQTDFHKVLDDIKSRKNSPILCGGTGLYLQVALQEENLLEVPEDSEWRAGLGKFNLDELVEQLEKLKPDLHNTSDSLDRERTIRAIELERYKKENPDLVSRYKLPPTVIFGIQSTRDALRDRIKQRLDARLKEGLIEEVESLMKNGLSLDDLIYYGLEYKFVGQHLAGVLTYDDMYMQLLQGIRRFAKKQMTWYRRMEKQGFEINWIGSELSMDMKIQHIKRHLNEKF